MLPHFIFFDFACRTDSTDIQFNDEAQEYVWVTLDEAMRLPMEHYTAIAIAEYRRPRTRSACDHGTQGVGGV